jgi:hypothetical protein
MHISVRTRSTALSQNARPDGAPSFFQAHSIAEIIPGIVFSSALWILLAFGVYMVYTMVLGVS